MALSFLDTKDPCQRALAISLVRLIECNIELYLHISRIFYLYSDPNDDLDEIHRQIKRMINNPSLKVDYAQKQIIIDLMMQIYNDSGFQNIRSDVLECVVYHFGPFIIKNENSCYIEPKIIDDDYLVGEAESRCDFVFYNNCAHFTEFIECKANIANVIPAEKPLEKVRSDHRKKIKYLVKAYHYLNNKYCEPVIFFACYNTNYERQLSNVHNNWGFKFVKFLGPQDICNYYNYS